MLTLLIYRGDSNVRYGLPALFGDFLQRIQNSSSRLTLVFLPLKVSVRWGMEEFGMRGAVFSLLSPALKTTRTLSRPANALIAIISK
jgi:hypothetical protein